MEERAGPSETNWPIPEFHFKVEWGSEVLSFREVLGLDVNPGEIKFRRGDTNEFSNIRMPGLVSFKGVTLKNGLFKGIKIFEDLMNKLKMNTMERAPMTISLLDEGSGAVMVWKLANAWPTKITSTDMNSESNEVAIETIEIMHEGLTISKF